METAIATSWHSYPKVYNIGHGVLNSLFADAVIVEEKLDGSQFSFGVFGPERALRCRSKGQELNLDAPEKMFIRAIETARELSPALLPDCTYRAEYLAKPKHNTLAYDRVPAKYLAIFDVNLGQESYLPYEAKAAEASRLGLECVPLLQEGTFSEPGALLALLERLSILGGQRIEGIVVKNYGRFGPDGKALMGKHVSEAFKETHRGDWRERNPNKGDIVDTLISKYRTPARWDKAVQHLRDAGTLESSPRDIGALIKESQTDVRAECEAEIKQELFDWVWPKLSRGLIAGLPEWYKQSLLASAFPADAGKDP